MTEKEDSVASDQDALLIDAGQSPKVIRQREEETQRRLEVFNRFGMADLGIADPQDGTPLDSEFCALTNEMLKRWGAAAAAVNLFFDQQVLVGLSTFKPKLIPHRTIPLGVGMCPRTMDQPAAHILFDLQGIHRFADTPLTRDPVNARSYLGKRLVADPRDEDSRALGTVCVVSQSPQDWSKEDIRDVKEIAMEAQALIQRRSRHRLV